MGISPKQSSQWQKLGAMPQRDFDLAIGETVKPPTVSLACGESLMYAAHQRTDGPSCCVPQSATHAAQTRTREAQTLKRYPVLQYERPPIRDVRSNGSPSPSRAR
jgi:hypothetical protein